MIYINSNDGTKIAVYDYNPCGQETVLLVHGWPLSHEIFEYQIEMLVNCGFRVVTLDLRGFGNSDSPSCGYDYNQMAKDLHMVVQSLGLKCFILGGFSMGGAVVLRYMKNFCGYGVKKLMLFAAAAPCFTKRPGFPYGVPRAEADQLICQARTDRPQLAETFSHKQLFACPHSEAVKGWFQDIALSASGIGTVLSAVALRDEDGRKDLSAVHIPTAIFQGAKDQVVPADLTMIQFRSIPGARLYTLENSGHGIMYDELERFNACLMDFLKQH